MALRIFVVVLSLHLVAIEINILEFTFQLRHVSSTPSTSYLYEYFCLTDVFEGIRNTTQNHC